MGALTLRTYIAAGFAFALLLTCWLGFQANQRLIEINAHADRINQAMPGIFLSGRMQSIAHETGMLMLKNLLSLNEEQHADFGARVERNLEDLANHFTEYSRTVHGIDAKRRILQLDTARTEYTSVIAQLVKFINEDKMQEAMEMKVMSLDPAFENLITATRAEVYAGKVNSDQAATGILASVSNAKSGIRNNLYTTLFVSILVASSIIWFTSKRLSTVTACINESARHVSDQAVALNSVSGAVSHGADAQCIALRDTRTTLAELASIADKTAEQSQQAEKLAREARGATNLAAASTAKMAVVMNAIKNTNAEMSSVTGNLSISADELQIAVDSIQSASREVANFVFTVDQIAEQTAMLAFNASVEAARSGVAGRSFAVVASEVKALAQGSRVAAGVIGERIKDMIRRGEAGVRVSARMVESIRALTQCATEVRIGVDQSSSQALEIETALKHIAALAQNVDKFVSHVANAVGDQTKSVSRITEALGLMSEVTENNTTHAANSLATARALQDEVPRLDEAVARLRNLAGDSQTTDDEIATFIIAENRPISEEGRFDGGN